METTKQISQFNYIEASYQRDATLHSLIEMHVDCAPQKIAASFQGQTLTYVDLETKSNRVANALINNGMRAGKFVGIFLERGLDLLVAQMGVLKSGAAFACFDPAFPGDALSRILDKLPLSLIITQRSLAKDFPSGGMDMLCLDDLAQLENVPSSRPVGSATPLDPAFLLFTSGSTGHPKTVLHTHRNVIARLSNTKSIADFDEKSIFAQISPISSIDALDELFLPLFCGGQIAITPYSVVVDIPLLAESLIRDGVTHLMLVPSLLRVLLSTAVDIETRFKNIKTCMVGGEPLTGSLAKQFHERLPDAQLINYYGLTEGDVSYHIVDHCRDYSSYVPIGKPIQNTHVYLLGETLELVPTGEVGEIYVAGEGLFREYLGSPELNAERWMANPFVDKNDTEVYTRLFKTGDLARIGLDGEIEYVGRKDRMVKIRGFRVELGEIEVVLGRHPDVRECIVTAYKSGGDDLRQDARLAAYVVLKPDRQITSARLLLYAAQHLPDFSVPSVVVLISHIPLSPNGKVDLKKLPEPLFVSLPERDQEIAAPRNPIELELAVIWEKLLRQPSIGVHDSFFEIGGDSLAAIDLTLQIEKKFNVNLPISALMEAPTIASLAEVLSGNKTYSWSSLVPIRASGKRPPLFCVHADGGVLFYYQFAQHLARDIPIYGLQARGLLGSNDQPLNRIEDMASHYINEMRTVQPSGPYYLCGYSTGGYIIFEMARQLQDMGEAVAMVCMLDTYGPEYPKLLPDKNMLKYKLSVHLSTLRTYGFSDQVKYLWERTWKRVAFIFSRFGDRLFPLLGLPLPHRVRYNQIARLVNSAEEAYEPKNYKGDIVLFRASVQPENIYPDPDLGWGNVVSGTIKAYDISGTHNSIMHMPHLLELISTLQEHLDELWKEMGHVEA